MKRAGRLNYKKHLLFLGSLVLCSFFLFIPYLQAQTDLGLNYAEGTGLGTTDIRVIIARIIRIVLGFLGIIALLIVLYGGFLWMVSKGEAEKVDKAKAVLFNGGIGLVIVLSAFAIAQFVLSQLQKATLGEISLPSFSSIPPVEQYSGALGNGIIESHYPQRGQTGVPRNTNIIVTFKEKMSLSSFINQYDNKGTIETSDDEAINNKKKKVSLTSLGADEWFELKTENIKIYPSEGGETKTLSSSEAKIRFTDDYKSFVFDPLVYLGSPSKNIWYTVSLTGGKNGLQKANNQPALSQNYKWDFETSTIIDLTPPQIIKVIPLENSSAPYNTLIQIYFSEAIDPTSATGEIKVIGSDTYTGPKLSPGSFDKITVKQGGIKENYIAGSFSLSNQYKTAEFKSNKACGTNSCGGTIYCLPSSSQIKVEAKAAHLQSLGPEAQWPYTGLVDMAANSLDGDGDSKAEGPPLDNKIWIFSTTALKDDQPPFIEQIIPKANEEKVKLDAPLSIRFNKIMGSSSLNTTNILLGGNKQSDEKTMVWYTLNQNLLDKDNKTTDKEAIKTELAVMHGKFIKSATIEKNGKPFEDRADYYPEARSPVTDIYQNCFFPSQGPFCAPNQSKPYCCVVLDSGNNYSDKLRLPCNP